MEEAVNAFHDFLMDGDKNKKTIIIKVDPDVDGYTSTALLTAIIYHYLDGANIQYIFGNRKEHGLTYKHLEDFSAKDIGLIFIPDASSKTKDILLINKNFNVPVIVLDHHLVETEYKDLNTNKWVSKAVADTLPEDEVEKDNYTNYCIAVNCHDGAYPNDTLSGVGVVRKFAEACCQMWNDNPKWLEKYIDLVSTGLIADGMDLKNLETRWYALEGIKEENQNNDFLNELEIRVNEDSVFTRTMIDVGWQLAPKINAVCRAGKDEEQVEVLRALLGIDETVVYKKRGKDTVPEEVSLPWNAARVACNVKNRQDAAIRKAAGILEDKISSEGLDKNSILFVPWDKTGEEDKGLTGVLANRLATKYKRPICILRSYNNETWGGSCRGYVNGSVSDLKSILEEAGVEVHGHANAAGINLPKKKLEAIVAKCNELVPLDEMTEIFEVDWEIPADKMENEYVRQVAENEAIWGNTVPKPKFAISNIYINASDIVAMGENATFIRFKHNGISYIKKYCRKEEFAEMTLADRKVFGKNTKSLVLNVIGEFQLDAYNDTVYPQVKILYYDVREAQFDELDKIPLSETTSTVTKKKKKSTSFDWEDDDLDLDTKSSKSQKEKESKKVTPVDLDDDDFDW